MKMFLIKSSQNREKKFKYPGHIITQDLGDDDEDMARKSRSIYDHGNDALI